ncbi:uncharacterized protein CYBJADRAFT_166403 [Cyberlindnera jadinii NRRL Y-1542]|uniref:Alpha/beta-hydrolase n=1 Tax=Cyberlindnera jadinii (strain ATCC 18201 / CBS 1600 / BCRC 20928 / JCM 3617 / NBRC 0987 / NRRL Y-1542) TaxID=983966 RepID=A0A1E4S515_CYBJN|nr:alpha/beta-hydrolase [Cyberlindnera jadinii NRRL Y-1542]ODV74604.1 alpha/beta-hydrolase [Cyberlindnera jadinii NRRL Y-1542]
MPTLSYTLKMFAAALASVSVVSLAALYRFQLKLIYPNTLNDARLKTDTPDEYDMPYENMFLETPDGEKIHTFLLLHDRTLPGYKNKTIIVLCPNAGNIGNSLPIVQLLYKEMGYNVLIFSYRGYGESTGTSTEDGIKTDADTVMKFVMEHDQLSNSSVVLYGRSLGGAVAIYIASKNYVPVKAVVLENTFLSIRKAIPHIFPFLRNFTFLCHQVWDSEHDILKVSPEVEMIFLCAEKDEIVPPDHMARLYELSPATVKSRTVFDGAHHNDTVVYPSYWNIVHDFIKSIPPVEH